MDNCFDNRFILYEIDIGNLLFENLVYHFTFNPAPKQSCRELTILHLENPCVLQL